MLSRVPHLLRHPKLSQVPITYLDTWHMESHWLKGALAKAQCPGKLHLPHLTHRFGQEYEALMGQSCEQGLGVQAGGSWAGSTAPVGFSFTLWGSLEVKLLHSRK